MRQRKLKTCDELQPNAPSRSSPYALQRAPFKAARLGQTLLTCNTMPLHVTCRECEMQYNKTVPEDCDLHRRYCVTRKGIITWSSAATSAHEKASSGHRILDHGSEKLECRVVVFQYGQVPHSIQVKVSL